MLFDDVEKMIEQQQRQQLFIQYGTPTITLSSNAMQVVGQGTDEIEAVLLDDDFELLIGSK